MERTRGVALSIVWRDGSLLAVRARGDNGRFAGEVDCYASAAELRSLADTVEGFPRDAKDRRLCQLGTFHESAAGGGCRLALHATEGVEPVAEVELTASAAADERREVLRLRFAVDRRAVARFAAELRAMRGEVGERATLTLPDNIA